MDRLAGGGEGSPMGGSGEDALLAQGGYLYTWGGEFTWVEHKTNKKGDVTEKKDSNKGCLGHGDTAGCLLPTK